MSIEFFSIILTLLCVGLLVVTVGNLVAYFFVSSFRQKVLSVEYWLFIKIIGGIAIISTVSVLVYQFVYLTPVCILCWWQRIFMFPIDVIAVVALVYRQKAIHVTVAILASIGLFFASYHYYFHFQGLVLKNVVSLPCSQVGLLPACTDSSFLIFGFSTIPFMATVAFLAILVLAFFAHQKFVSVEKTV